MARFSSDGQWQELNTESKLDVPLLDLSEKGEKERQDELAEAVSGEVSHEFDLSAGPLVRVQIARIARDNHVAIWTAHHIVCDGWSGGLVIHELGTIYSALKQGVPPNLEAPQSFEQYARDAQNDAKEADAIRYWRQQFAELPAPLDLPTDRSRPKVRTASASTVKRNLDTALQQAVKRVAGQQRTTQVVLLMAALKTLLYRLTGQSDQVVGLGVAGQALKDQSNLVVIA